MKKTIYYWR